MRIPELGQAVKEARIKKGLTQTQLAAAAGLSRNTLNRLENGLFPDLGVKKASRLLEKVGLDLAVQPMVSKQTKSDYVSMACASAGVSFKKQLMPDELIHALLSGKATPGKQAHYIVLLEEAPAVLMHGLIEQVGGWVKPGKVKNNIGKIAQQVGLKKETAHWSKIA